jgi:hypothetical protein
MLDKAIVITSILNPTKAVKAFAKLREYRLIVVGDCKTPTEWYYDNVIFLSLQEQKNYRNKLSQILPENHYSRKMIGYLRAISLGAEVIIDTDDDNIPLENWGFPDFYGFFFMTPKECYFINVYKYFTQQHIWPRGLPLKLINNPNAVVKDTSLVKSHAKIGVWQGLANGDPDVDAIYRLTVNGKCWFDDKEPIILDEGTLSSFNSQNTAFVKELFPLLYLPAYVNFRFTDILRSYVAQPIMWVYGYRLGYLGATVFQERNEHDYLKDFESEIPCYLCIEKVVEIVRESIRKEYSIKENLYLAYEALNKNNIVIDKEMEVLEAWLRNF